MTWGLSIQVNTQAKISLISWKNKPDKPISPLPKISHINSNEQKIRVSKIRREQSEYRVIPLIVQIFPDEKA